MSVLRLITTRAAERQLQALTSPLDVQIELLFSCVIRKRLLFRIPPGVKTYPMQAGSDRLNIQFRPVMTRVCLFSEVEDVPDLEDFPLAKVGAFMPKWLKLDYRKGQWKGDFGWVGP